jgi:hypothetical protein
MKRPALVVIALVAMAACASPAGAQTIYKYLRADGRVIYSDKPVPGATLQEEFEPPPPPDPAAVARALKDNEAGTKALERAAALRARLLDQAWEELKLWSRRLEEARSNLEAGREPREGERTGTFGGRARMNDSYWKRQWENESALREAEARIRQAQDSINALR